MGEALAGLAQRTEAMAYYNQALCMALRVYQQEHPRITQYLKDLINTLNKLGDQTLLQPPKPK